MMQASTEANVSLLPSISLNESVGSDAKNDSRTSTGPTKQTSNISTINGGLRSQNIPSTNQKAKTKKLRALDVKSHQHPWDVSRLNQQSSLQDLDLESRFLDIL